MKPIGELAPGHLGHHDVGQQQIDVPAVQLPLEQRVASAPRKVNWRKWRTCQGRTLQAIMGRMSIDNAGIFGDDVAVSTRSGYLELIDKGLSPEQATAQLVEDSDGLLEEDDSYRCPFWLGLADTQQSRGELLPDVKAAALAVIGDGTDLRLWAKDPEEDRAARARALEELRARLDTKAPAKSRATRKRLLPSPWKNDEVFAWELAPGKLALLHVFAMIKDAPVLYAFDWTGAMVPDLEVIRELQLKPSKTAAKFSLILPETKVAADVARWSSEVMPRAQPTGIQLASNRSTLPCVMVFWQDLVGHLSEQYDW
jgi:hypothetical protein